MAADVRRKLAEAYARVGDMQAAALEYQRVADLLPKRDDVQLAAGQVLLLSGQFDDARARAQILLARDPGNVDAQVLLGNSLAGMNDLDHAVREIEQAIELDPRRALSYSNLGSLQFQRGHRAEAEAAYRKAVRTDTRSANARLALANFLWATERGPEAEALMKEAIALDPKNAVARRALAAYYMSTNRVAEAEGHLLAAAENTPGSSPRLVLADYYIGQGRVQDALQVLEAASRVRESYVPAKARMAAVLYEQGRKEQAYEIIAELLRRSPREPVALMMKGRFFLAEGKTNEAGQQLKAALDADPRLAAAHYLLGMVLLPQDPDAAIRSFTEAVRLAPRAVPALIQLVRLYLAQGKSDVAAQFASEAVWFQADNYDAHELFARSLLANDELDGARREIQWLKRAAPNRADGPILEGILAAATDQPAEATRHFERALVLDPRSVEALTGVVRLDLRAGRMRRARERIAAQVGRGHVDSAVYLLAADVAEAEKDTKRVESNLLKAVEVQADNLDAYLRLGRFYVEQGRLADALTRFQAIATRRPTAVAAQTMIGMVFQLQGRLADAQRQYENVLLIDSRAPVAANNLACMYAERGGNLDVALQLAQTAKARMPNRPEFNDTLGWIYYKKGLPSLAIGPLLQATDQAPNNPTYKLHLGLAFGKAGEKAKAKTAIDSALAANPKLADGAEVREALQALSK